MYIYHIPTSSSSCMDRHELERTLASAPLASAQCLQSPPQAPCCYYRPLLLSQASPSCHSHRLKYRLYPPYLKDSLISSHLRVLNSSPEGTATCATSHVRVNSTPAKLNFSPSPQNSSNFLMFILSEAQAPLSPLNSSSLVLFCSGCYKYHRLGGLNRNLFLRVLEAQSPRSRH